MIEDLGPGGAQRQMVNLGLELSRRGYNVVFLYYAKGEYYVPVLADAGIEVVVKYLPNRLKRIFRISRFIRSRRFDTVISFLSPSNFISSVATLPVKRWRVIVGERSANPLMLRSFKSWVIRLFFLRADFVVANSESNLAMVRRINPFLNASRCKVIYNLVDLNTWKPSPDFQFRKDGKVRMVVAASHRRLKNLRGLVDALMLLDPADRAKLDIRWYGDRVEPPYYDQSYLEAKSLIDRHSLGDVISFFPASRRIREIMSSADVVCLFSFFEGLPNAVCEGMALGKPILATRVSDLPLLVKHNHNGFLCDSNGESIARSIKEILDMPATELARQGANSRAIAMRLFDHGKIVDDYEALLKL